MYDVVALGELLIDFTTIRADSEEQRKIWRMADYHCQECRIETYIPKGEDSLCSSF